MAHTNCLYKIGFMNMALALLMCFTQFLYIIYRLTPGRNAWFSFVTMHTYRDHHSSTQKWQNARGEVWWLNPLNSKISSLANQHQEKTDYLKAHTENNLLQRSPSAVVHGDASIIDVPSPQKFISWKKFPCFFSSDSFSAWWKWGYLG